MRAGDIVRVDFGVPEGSEPGFSRPAIIVTADLVLSMNPRTIHVVPLTSNVTRRLPTELVIEASGLEFDSVAQGHLCAVVSTSRISDDDAASRANVGLLQLSQLRQVVADLLDLP